VKHRQAVRVMVNLYTKFEESAFAYEDMKDGGLGWSGSSAILPSHLLLFPPLPSFFPALSIVIFVYIPLDPLFSLPVLPVPIPVLFIPTLFPSHPRTLPFFFFSPFSSLPLCLFPFRSLPSLCPFHFAEVYEYGIPAGFAAAMQQSSLKLPTVSTLCPPKRPPFYFFE